MHPNGVMNDLAGQELAGLDRFEARKVAAERLRELGVLEKEEPHQNNVGYSERADVPIEPRLSEQWFLRYPSIEEARTCVQPAGTSAAAPATFGALDAGAPLFDPGMSMTGTFPDAGLGMLNPIPFPLNAGPTMRFYPERWAKVYDHWMGNLQDWCISRQLWWGHRIPVWYRKSEESTEEEREMTNVRWPAALAR
jgi:valyl-tRNA synthetase